VAGITTVEVHLSPFAPPVAAAPSPVKSVAPVFGTADLTKVGLLVPRTTSAGGTQSLTEFCGGEVGPPVVSAYSVWPVSETLSVPSSSAVPFVTLVGARKNSATTGVACPAFSCRFPIVHWIAVLSALVVTQDAPSAELK